MTGTAASRSTYARNVYSSLLATLSSGGEAGGYWQSASALQLWHQRRGLDGETALRLVYIRNLSLALDAYVILETIKTVLMRRGS